MNKSERLRLLLWRLDQAASAMEAGADPKYAEVVGLPHTVGECAEVIRYLIRKVTDTTLCNNDCKGMYYCELQKNHKGQHKEQGLSWD